MERKLICLLKAIIQAVALDLTDLVGICKRTFIFLVVYTKTWSSVRRTSFLSFSRKIQ